jgi:alkylation response protein AidB-like acyl-CoA dehydrogenase
MRSGNGYILNDTKRYITNAPFANVALIMARTSKEALPKNAHVSAFLVPMNTAGISVGSAAAGYLAEYDAERFFRDSRICRIYQGTTQILQLQIAKNMLREFAGKL